MFIKFCLIILAVPVAAFMRLLRPLVIVRLAPLDISRIGGIYHADWYLSGCSFKLSGRRYFDVFYFVTANTAVCNRQWAKMWQRVLRIFPFGRFAGWVDKVSKALPGHDVHVLPIRDVSHVTLGHEKDNLGCILAHKSAHISFTQDEEKLGQKALSDLGLPQGQSFVCFHARDAAYLDAVYPGNSWSYHDFRDSNISNYVPAIQELAGEGYYAVRMGAIVKDKLRTTHPAIIDYAAGGKRSDFLDIYLGAKCKFFICSQTGISIVPEMFRCPLVYVNWSALGQMPLFVHNGLLIPKKLYSRKEGRFLTFAEIINSQTGLFYDGRQFEESGIELFENTPQEIAAVVMEMHQRLNGSWQTSEEDERLQRSFWALFGPDKPRSPQMRIGAEFLRQNQGFLKPQEIHHVKVGVS